MNGGCEDICQVNDTGIVVCKCRDGRRLLEDGYRCVSTAPDQPKCSDSEFTCSEKQCIPYEVTCDGIYHCSDKSDEDPIYCSMSWSSFIPNTIHPRLFFSFNFVDISGKRVCRQGYFACDHNRCFSNSYKCDGFSQCLDDSDESDCPCPEHHFRCGSGECLPDMLFCNGDRDCHDYSDEKNCRKIFNSIIKRSVDVNDF